jgi:hypothetical protein
MSLVLFPIKLSQFFQSDQWVKLQQRECHTAMKSCCHSQ